MARKASSSPGEIISEKVELRAIPIAAYVARPFVNVERSKAHHAFFCDERGAYEPNAARQAWALTLEFLRS